MQRLFLLCLSNLQVKGNKETIHTNHPYEWKGKLKWVLVKTAPDHDVSPRRAHVCHDSPTLAMKAPQGYQDGPPQRPRVFRDGTLTGLLEI